MTCSGQKSIVKEHEIVLFGWFDKGVGWSVGHLFVLFVVIPPMFFVIPSFDGWKMERILL